MARESAGNQKGQDPPPEGSDRGTKGVIFDISATPPAPGILFDKIGTQYILGRQFRPHARHAIWRRFEPGPPIATFFLRPEGAAAVWKQFAKLDPGPFVEVESPKDLLECLYLGGHGSGLKVNQLCDVRFTEEACEVWSIGAESPDMRLSLAEIGTLEISGPGKVSQGLKWWGGGFGVEGALKGMLTATALSFITSRTKVHTFLRLGTRDVELNFHYGLEAPEALRIRLSEVFAALQRPGPSSSALVSRLSELADLVKAGLLSKTEYNKLKSRLLKEGDSPADSRGGRDVDG